MTQEEYFKWLKEENGYIHVEKLDDKRYSAILMQIYSCSIIIGNIGDMGGYNECYWYTSLPNCLSAMKDWKARDKTIEPQGWIRHTPSNRRLENGKIIIRE